MARPEGVGRKSLSVRNAVRLNHPHLVGYRKTHPYWGRKRDLWASRNPNGRWIRPQIGYPPLFEPATSTAFRTAKRAHPFWPASPVADLRTISRCHSKVLPNMATLGPTSYHPLIPPYTPHTPHPPPLRHPPPDITTSLGLRPYVPASQPHTRNSSALPLLLCTHTPTHHTHTYPHSSKPYLNPWTAGGQSEDVVRADVAAKGSVTGVVVRGGRIVMTASNHLQMLLNCFCAFGMPRQPLRRGRP